MATRLPRKQQSTVQVCDRDPSPSKHSWRCDGPVNRRSRFDSDRGTHAPVVQWEEYPVGIGEMTGQFRPGDFALDCVGIYSNNAESWGRFSARDAKRHGHRESKNPFSVRIVIAIIGTNPTSARNEFPGPQNSVHVAQW